MADAYGGRPQLKETLEQIVATYGGGNATAFMRGLVEQGLAEQNRLEQVARKADGREAGKTNPYVTDIGKCERAVYKSLMNEEGLPLETDSLINFGVGHAVEEWLGEVMMLQGATVLRELRIENPTPQGGIISGRADFMFAWPEEHILCELKTTSSRAMYWMLKKGEPGKEDHRSQINQYMHASQGQRLFSEDHLTELDLKEGPVFDKGFLIYLVKDAVRGEKNLHAWEVPYDKELAEHHLWQLGKVVEKAEAGADPGIPAGYEPKKFPCSYCAFRKACWGGKAV